MQWIEDFTELQRSDHENELFLIAEGELFYYLHSDSRIEVIYVTSLLFVVRRSAVGLTEEHLVKWAPCLNIIIVIIIVIMLLF